MFTTSPTTDCTASSRDRFSNKMKAFWQNAFKSGFFPARVPAIYILTALSASLVRSSSGTDLLFFPRWQDRLDFSTFILTELWVKKKPTPSTG